MSSVSEPGLAQRVVKQLGEQFVSFMKRSTVYFGLADGSSRTARLAGSGVLLDLHGTKIVVTAGHVLRDFARDFEHERMFLSLNQRRGAFQIKPFMPRLVSPGDAHGPDAGVLVFPDDDGNTYFNFGGFEPARWTTIKASVPPLGLECIVAGFPELFVPDPRIEESAATIEVIVKAYLVSVVSAVVECDGQHAWLQADGLLDIDTDKSIVLQPGALSGMSGGGCWSVEVDREAQELKFFLHGVHTATQLPRLRETPMIHHLRLLANMNLAMRERVTSLWPEADLALRETAR